MANAMDQKLMDMGARVNRNLDVPLVIAIIALLFTILVPLPPLVMDLFLVINITLSMVILVTTVYMVRPLDFSVFPSLLLMTTFFRLALNVATTRLILTNDAAGEAAAAGRVVQAFGNFVAGSNIFVGAVIFGIIFIIQFIVITKGATRVSEVAARFTLDAMPGKQLSIDADLNAGLISDHEARSRRERISKEADFFGAMDGASKFVRGDAIAGVVITFINIIGGFAIGVSQHGMAIGEAMQVYTKLTIGDGLVSQIPALLISVAAGLLVTRSTAESHLGKELFGQILGNSKALYLTAGFLLALLGSGLPVGVLLFGAATCAGLGFALGRIRENEEMRSVREATQRQEKPPVEKARGLLAVELLELEVGYGLIHLVDGETRDNLLRRIGRMREEIALELGFVIPPIRIRDNVRLDADEYVIKLRGAPVGAWKVLEGRLLAMDSGDVAEPIAGTPTIEPTFHVPSLWITEAQRPLAEAAGYTVVDPVGVVATHLAEVVRAHSAELLTRDEVAKLIKGLEEKAPALVSDVIPDVVKPAELQRVLQGLLRERVGIRDLETIVGALGEHVALTKDPALLTEHVRQALGRSLCRQHAHSDGKLHVVTLDPALEDFLHDAIERCEARGSLALSPEMLGVIVGAIGDALGALARQGMAPVVLCASSIRPHVRAALEGKIPGAVLSYDEIVKDVEVEPHGIVRIERMAGSVG